MTEKRFFHQLSGGERFLHCNEECLKLYETFYIVVDYAPEDQARNAVRLDSGQLIWVHDQEEVIWFTRRY